MRPAFAIALVLLAACDTDLTGMYEVTAEVDSSPCGDDQPVVGGSPFLRFEEQEFIGQEFFTWQGCSDRAGTDCQSIGGLFEGLTEPIDGGWRGRTIYSSHGSTTCLLGLDETTAILSGDKLVVEQHTFEEQIDYVEATCTIDEAERRGDAMPCTQHHRVDANQL